MAKKSGMSPLLRVGLPAILATGYYFFFRPQMLKSGTLLGEPERRLPGDDVIITPNFQSTRAINIDAPPEAVWPWITQIGRDRSGFYGADAFTNGGLPSIAYLRQDLPAPEVGMELDGGYRILDLEENKLFVYGGFDLPTWTGEPTERTTLLLLERNSNGSTRLIVRTRGYAYGMFSVAYNLTYELIDYLHATAQLENIRQRAEMMAHLRAPKALPASN